MDASVLVVSVAIALEPSELMALEDSCETLAVDREFTTLLDIYFLLQIFILGARN